MGTIVGSHKMLCSMRLIPLEQGLADFFCEESDSKYFRLLGPFSLGCNYSSATAAQKQSQTVCKWMDVAGFQENRNGPRADLAHGPVC